MSATQIYIPESTFNINLLGTYYVLGYCIRNFTYEVSCDSHNPSVK